MKTVFVIILLTTCFIGRAWAGPQKKVTQQNVTSKKATSAAELSVKESYSVAMTGMETETFRVQVLQLKGKTFFMASQLVNGDLYKEISISAAEINTAKKAMAPLAALGNSDICTKPVTIIIATQRKTESKVCSEKPEVLAEIARFNDLIKEFISKD